MKNPFHVSRVRYVNRSTSTSNSLSLLDGMDQLEGIKVQRVICVGMIWIAAY